MRAALHEAWPALTFHFGIGPHNFTDYSWPEIRQYLNALAEMNRG